jgi:phospholipid/cholesterol/gamma-HCH transport system substrate-binding protein
MANSVAEAVIGAVVLATAAGFVFYAGQSRGVQMGGDSTLLHASFRSAEGITVGTDVRLAGINVGSVTGLELDPATFEARTSFTVDGKLRLPADSDVKIASESLLGGNYVEITPGASEEVLGPGDEIVNTQGSVSLLNLLMRFGTGK